MPKNSSKRATVRSRLARLSRNHLAVLAAFIITFVSFGSWFVYRSEAGWSCAQHVYYQGEPGIYHGYCVYKLQEFLNFVHGTYVGAATLPVAHDGVYGSGTAGSIAHFQTWVSTHAFIYGTLKAQGVHLPLSPDGYVGRGTWFALCDTAASLGQYYYDLGCNVSTSTYGKYYVSGGAVY